MWERLSSFILRYRVLLLILIIVFTASMGFIGRKVEMSYVFSGLLPQKDSAAIEYQKFVHTFGEEGNVIIIAVKDKKFFQLGHFNKWKELCNGLRNINGVKDMLSIPNSYQLVKNSKEKKFSIKPIFSETGTQAELDSMSAIFRSIPLYRGYLYNDSSSTYLAVLTMNKDQMVTKERESVIQNIDKVCKNFEESTNLKIRRSGMPYINVKNSILIKKEIYLFTALALVVCLVILFLFFKSFKAMIFPALVVLCGVLTALGTMVLFDYKITILTGMIPPLLIVIGIPNSIYILNKYHQEYRLHQNKIKALKRVIMKIGNAIFLTNLTTAAGFATFIITNSKVLKEFGVIASINILFLFVLSILLIPIIFSFLPPPEERQIQHLDRKVLGKITDRLVNITLNHRKTVYWSMIIVVAISIYGITLMKTSGYMLDDIPDSSPIKIDLKYLESNFEGVFPMEIIIDTKKRNGLLQTSTMKKIDALDKRLQQYSELSPSLSYVNVVKLAKQAFYNGNEKYYSLPTSTERNFILSYVGKGSASIGMAHSFVDSTLQKGRVSLRVKDIGTNEMNLLYSNIINDITELFPSNRYNVIVTGTMVVSTKGNQYLIKNLFISLALAIVVIAIFMALMFRSKRMVLLSMIPNIIPLLFTAGIMGFTNIPIKSSTILIFSVAFGISVDNTIHFLAKYRQELNATRGNIQKSVIKALKETGVSMIYTFTVLFFGFGMFTLSKFGGIQALGILISLTLLIALIANLLLLPALIIGLEKFMTTKSFKESLLENYDDEEDIDLNELEIDHQTPDNGKNQDA